MEKTYFISFEGIDGCGKDTQINKLVEAIREDNNYPFGDKYSTIWITREPTKITKPGIEISELMRGGEVSKEKATELFIKDRKEHSKIIKKTLEFSHVIISRYDLSTFSYQMTQGMDFEQLYKYHSYSEESGCLIPHITVVFDIGVDEAMRRINNRNSKEEIFEKEEFQRKLKDNLKECIKRLREMDGRKIVEVNANQSIEEVTKEMLRKIDVVINN